MKSNEVLLRLLHRAFIDIRLASRGGDVRIGDRLSDLLHNVPTAMINVDPDEVLKRLTDRAEILGLSSWVETALGDISHNQRAKD